MRVEVVRRNVRSVDLAEALHRLEHTWQWASGDRRMSIATGKMRPSLPSFPHLWLDLKVEIATCAGQAAGESQQSGQEAE